MNNLNEVQSHLFELRDEKYKQFTSRLLPTVDSELIIGVRTPLLRQFARQFSKTSMAARFLVSLPHTYYEENNLHAFLIEQIRDPEKCISALNTFLPYTDNWATCDSMSPKIFKKHPQTLLPAIKRWMASQDTYAVRFGIKMLMEHFLDEKFKPCYAEQVAKVRSEEYYINMMMAWYFATALAKQYESIVPFIEQKKLPEWVHNKTIQKACESYRITSEQKAYLRKYKIK